MARFGGIPQTLPQTPYPGIAGLARFEGIPQTLHQDLDPGIAGLARFGGIPQTLPQTWGPGIAGLARFGGSPKPDLRPYPQTPNLRGRFGGSPKPYPYPDRDGDRIPEPVASPDAIPDPVPGSDLDSDPTLSEPVELCAHPVSSAFGIATKDSRPLSTHRTRARFLTAVWRTATQQQHTIGDDSIPIELRIACDPDCACRSEAALAGADWAPHCEAVLAARAKSCSTLVSNSLLMSVEKLKPKLRARIRFLACSSPHLTFLLLEKVKQKNLSLKVSEKS